MANIFKKLLNVIFEEEVIDEPVEEKPAAPVKEEVKVEEKVQETVKEEVKVEEKPVEKPVEKKEASMLGKVEVSAEPSKTAQKKTSKMSPKIEYEFTPVISPIYGIPETEKTKPVTTQSATKKNYKASSTPTGIVLSPINGNISDERKVEVKVKETINVPVSEPVADKEEEIEDIPLSDIIENVTPYGTSKESRPATEKEVADKKVLLSKNLSLFDDEE